MQIGPFKIFTSSKQDSPPEEAPKRGYNFSDEERARAEIGKKAAALERARLKALEDRLESLRKRHHELAMIEKIEQMEADLEEWEEGDDDSEEDSEQKEDPLSAAGAAILAQLLTPSGPRPQTPPPLDPVIEVNNNPYQNVPDPPRLDEKQIRDLVAKIPGPLKNYIRQVDQGSLLRAIEIIKLGK